MRQSWSEMVHGLGGAVLTLLKAELEVIERELGASGKNLGIGLGLFAAAGAFGFWTLGVATYFLIQLLALWLPLWAASLVLTVLFALIVGGLAFAGLKKLEKVENPLGTVRRRIEDNAEWWQSRVIEPAERPAGYRPVGPRPGHGLEDER